MTTLEMPEDDDPDSALCDLMIESVVRARILIGHARRGLVAADSLDKTLHRVMACLDDAVRCMHALTSEKETDHG